MRQKFNQDKVNCPNCGSPNDPQDKHCSQCSAILGNGENLPPNLEIPTLGDRLFAAFDQRLSATLIDLLVIIILYLLFGFLLSIISRLTGLFDPLPVWGKLLVELYLPALAYAALTLRLFSASAGKRFLGIQVLRSDGSSVGWGRAFLREFVKLSPLLPVVVFMAALRNDKRGLHDMLADTVVVHTTPGIPAGRIE